MEPKKVTVTIWCTYGHKAQQELTISPEVQAAFPKSLRSQVLYTFGTKFGVLDWVCPLRGCTGTFFDLEVKE